MNLIIRQTKELNYIIKIKRYNELTKKKKKMYSKRVLSRNNGAKNNTTAAYWRCIIKGGAIHYANSIFLYPRNNLTTSIKSNEVPVEKNIYIYLFRTISYGKDEKIGKASLKINLQKRK